MLFLYLHSKHHFIFITGFFCLLTVSRSYDNIALNKQAYQQNQFLAGNDKYDASNTVDGLKSDLTSNGDQCAISAAKQTATLWVNLTAIHSIHHITIYFMTNDLKWGSSNALTPLFLGFSVYVSNTTDKLGGMLCFKDTIFTLDTIPAVFTTACPVHGQYVIYYNERLSWLTYPTEYSPCVESNLCEVEVYGCAVGEHYGVNCSIPCPDVNCQFCHIETGTCQGCKSGYQGHRCELACPYGFFGQGCADKCNEKCNGCNTVNGLCDYGCKSGWTGDNCNEACDKGLYGVECNETCGYCREINHCFHIDGKCLTGCNESYLGELCKIRRAYDETSFISPNIPLVGVSIAAAVVIFVVIVGLFIYKRCRIRKGQMEQRKVSICETAAYTCNTEQADLCIYQNVEENKTNGVKVCSNTSTQEVRKSKFDIDNMDFDGNIGKKIMYGDICWRAKTNPGVIINNFEKIIGENSKNEDDGFKKEYESLPYGERYPCKTGILPENVQKNRFKTTYTYDHSRVILTDRQQDYINANYIDGTEKPDVYIAAQGPKKNTLEDFWFMIWQENIEQIVMLTNLKEKARTKCVQYWPDLKMEMSCDFLELYTTEECLYDNYVIRKLKVSHARQNESRMITQYHYTAWSDHGTPDPLCLLSFHGHLKRTKTSRNLSPILVHCSAGIGRTGTFIAIDALYEEGQKTGKVYIADYVTKMREKRMNMVQTYEQYKTIFLTLYEMFKEPTACHNTGNSIQNLQTIKNTIRSMYCESEGGSRDASSRLASLHKEHGYKMMSEEGVAQSLICPQNQKMLIDS
nr:uncharacterized protein LOC117687580 [Crassostrea gigas]